MGQVGFRLFQTCFLAVFFVLLSACDVNPVASDYEQSRKQVAGNSEQNNNNNRNNGPGISQAPQEPDSNIDNSLDELDDSAEDEPADDNKDPAVNDPVNDPVALAAAGRAFFLENNCMAACHPNPAADIRLQGKDEATIYAGRLIAPHPALNLTWNEIQSRQLVAYFASLTAN